ncbi:MAG: hypothetical protein CMJ40_02960 [Phycisphaerae bacterium]|nr:hypothetical protein [Phycisphaerae bacterium]|tara:strand:+ start:2424 stop:3887 length:1464 start_codon:yes stop_codon:yes gene_type:complete
MRAICAILASLLLAGTSFAATINVPADYPTIQGAIDASSNGDVIQIAAGTFYENGIVSENKAITIQGTLNGDGSLATTIDGQDLFRVFEIWGIWNEQGGNEATLKNLIITRGYHPDGGGIECGHYTVIEGCHITNCYSQTGGGISAYMNNTTIRNCTISGNTSEYGGGIAVSGSSDGPGSIINCLIENNMDGELGFGGGIYANAQDYPVDIIDCTIQGNDATMGGGIFSNSFFANIRLNGCTVRNNYTGIYSDKVTITDSIICGNAGYQIDGTWIDGNGNFINDTCQTLIGACCLDGLCTLATEQDCNSNGGEYLGDNSDCTDDPCYIPPVIGACCTNDTCLQTLEADCLYWGGDWLGEDSSCDECEPSAPCDPTGACCLNGGCIIATATDCIESAGDYAGDDVPCSNAGCPPPVEPDLVGACCIGGNCVVTTGTDCLASDGNYAGDDVTCPDANCPTICLGDANGDGEVSVNDILLVISQFGVTCP